MRNFITAVLVLGLLAPGWAVAQEAKTEHGVAAVYAQKLVGHRTTSGETLDRDHLTAAHRSLPFGTIIEVTNRANGSKAMVRINDRGPHRHSVLLDLSPAPPRRSVSGNARRRWSNSRRRYAFIYKIYEY